MRRAVHQCLEGGEGAPGEVRRAVHQCLEGGEGAPGEVRRAVRQCLEGGEGAPRECRQCLEGGEGAPDQEKYAELYASASKAEKVHHEAEKVHHESALKAEKVHHEMKAEIKELRYLLSFLEYESIDRTQRAFLELLFEKSRSILEESSKISDEERKRLKTGKMTVINGVVPHHWRWLAAELFPCKCVPEFPGLRNDLLYGKLSQRIHRPMADVIFVRNDSDSVLWPYVAKMFEAEVHHVNTDEARRGWAMVRAAGYVRTLQSVERTSEA